MFVEHSCRKIPRTDVLGKKLSLSKRVTETRDCQWLIVPIPILILLYYVSSFWHQGAKDALPF